MSSRSHSARCTCREDAYATEIQIGECELPLDDILTLSEKSYRLWKKAKKCPRGCAGGSQGCLQPLSITIAKLVYQLECTFPVPACAERGVLAVPPFDDASYQFADVTTPYAAGDWASGSWSLPQMTLGTYQLDASESQLLTGSLLRHSLKRMGKVLFEMRQKAKDARITEDECPIEETLARLLRLMEVFASGSSTP